MPEQRKANDSGYLLVESLAALAIVAMMAGMVFETVWQVGQTRLRSGQQREAVLLAQSVMAAATVQAIPAEGRDGALDWAFSTEPWTSDDGALDQVHVTVRGTDGTILARLDSLRSAP